jgi:hypothetical protein
VLRCGVESRVERLGIVMTPSSLFRAADFEAGVFGIHSSFRLGRVGVEGSAIDELFMMNEKK